MTGYVRASRLIGYRSIALALSIIMVVSYTLLKASREAESTRSYTNDFVMDTLRWCVTSRTCVGGFIETNGGAVLRIIDHRPSPKTARHATIPLSTLEAYLYLGLRGDHLRHLVTPHDSRWNSFAARHAHWVEATKK